MPMRTSSGGAAAGSAAKLARRARARSTTAARWSRSAERRRRHSAMESGSSASACRSLRVSTSKTEGSTGTRASSCCCSISSAAAKSSAMGDASGCGGVPWGGGGWKAELCDTHRKSPAYGSASCTGSSRGAACAAVMPTRGARHVGQRCRSVCDMRREQLRQR